MTQIDASTKQALLIPGLDPEPVELLNKGSASPFLLVCEHAGNSIPDKLANLGLCENKLGLHIALDIGAGKVARELAKQLHCTLILQRYSRLVIDCNRPPGTPTSIPPISDSITIPGNINLSAQSRKQREQSIFAPYSQQCETEIAHAHIDFAYSIHSFTPQMDGLDRPWDIGFLYRHCNSQGEQLVKLFHELWPEFKIGLNQPYAIEDSTDWFIPVCAETHGVSHSLIEIRNDHLLTTEDCRLWAKRLYHLFNKFKEQTDATHS